MHNWNNYENNKLSFRPLVLSDIHEFKRHDLHLSNNFNYDNDQSSSGVRLLQASRANVCLWKKSVCNDEHFRLIILISVSISPKARYAVLTTKKTYWNSRNTITDGRLDSACCQSLKRIQCLTTTSTLKIFRVDVLTNITYLVCLVFFQAGRELCIWGHVLSILVTWLWFIYVEVEVYNIVSTKVL